MNIEEFLKRFAEEFEASGFTAIEIYCSGCLRLGKNPPIYSYCPLNFMAERMQNKELEDRNWKKVASIIGLDIDDARHLVYAADNERYGVRVDKDRVKSMRSQLKEVLNITDTTHIKETPATSISL